jgi:hypothetical protein
MTDDCPVEDMAPLFGLFTKGGRQLLYRRHIFNSRGLSKTKLGDGFQNLQLSSPKPQMHEFIRQIDRWESHPWNINRYGA